MPTYRFGPLPDLPPAGYGMTRSAQVSANTEGTPAFIPRPDTGLSRRFGVLSVTYPLRLPRPVRKSSLPPLPSTTGTLPPGCRQLQPRAFHHHPPNGKGRTGRLLLLRKTQVAVAVAACGLLTASALSFAPRRAAGDFLTIWAVALCGCKSQIHKTPQQATGRPGLYRSGKREFQPEYLIPVLTQHRLAAGIVCHPVVTPPRGHFARCAKEEVRERSWPL